jgi:hypothetical protein
MEFLIQPKIMSDFEGYRSLINLNNEIQQCSDEVIILNFKNNSWFEANLFSILGAFRAMVEEQNKILKLINLNPALQNIIQRNKFSDEYSEESSPDSKHTIVSFKKYTPFQDIEFMEYILTELLSKPDFPRHSKRLGKKINESIFELFENARTHGVCKHIFTCGQYYPGKKKRLDMTIVDMGKTIKANVNEYLKKNLSGSEAIIWAMQYGHTTKTGVVSGGLGLDIIFEFIKLNKGKIQIVSSDGYWEFKGDEIETRLFENFFPGTIANIEFNLDDKDSYLLTEEISLDDIF